MGLDAVELVMECEDVFGIALTDQDLPEVETLGDLHALIELRLDWDPAADKSLSSAVFYRLRDALIACGISRENVRPDAIVGDLIPAQQRRVIWGQFSAASGLRLPALVRPHWVAWLGLLFLLGVPGMTWVIWRPAMPASVAVAIAGAIALYHLTAPFRQELPFGCRTIRDLVYMTAVRNRRAFPDSYTMTHNETWETLRGIVSRQLGISRETLTPQTKLKDLL